MLDEITDRLTAEVKARVAFATNLAPALKLACHQLELLCPAVMGATRAGVVATLATTVRPGTWLIVLANPRKVMTIHFRAPPEGVTRLEVIADCVAHMKERLGRHDSDCLRVIEFMADKYGSKPGTRSPSADEQTVMRSLGVLFGAYTSTERNALVAAVEEAIEGDVCPLHVGLTGKGTAKGSLCGVWPLGLPFAPYAESLVL